MSNRYYELNEEWYHTEHKEIFFAFSQDRFEEEKAKLPKGAKVYRGPAGMFGTDKGFKDFEQALQDHNKKVASECEPLDVYIYEFYNHECGYTGDDSEAVEIVKNYWPDADIEALRKARKERK